MGLSKKNFKSDCNGAIPVIAWVFVAVVTAIGGYIAVENLTQQPDITYNISDTGFSIAGVDVSWLWIIVIVAGIVIVILFLATRRKPQASQQPIIIRERY